MKYRIVLTLLLFSFRLFGQNLISDPGFEKTERSTIKQLSSKQDKLLHWVKIIPWGKRFSFSGFINYLEYSRSLELDTIISSKPGMIERIRSWWKPHRGNSMFTPSYTFFTNLYQSRLMVKLQKDSVYYFQMHLKVMANRYGNSDFTKGKVGVWFTNHVFTDSAGQMIMQKNKLKITPHIHVKDFNSKENFKWIKYTTTFKSDKDYEYVIIGNFEPLMDQTAEMWTKKEGINYKFDDMCLVPFRLKEYCFQLDSEDIFELRNIHFDVNKYDLNKVGLKDLFYLATYLKGINITLEIKGYADSTGDESDNLDLSNTRAKTVYDFLAEKGIETSRMTYKGEGIANPVETNDLEEGRSLNRRVEIKINME